MAVMGLEALPRYAWVSAGLTVSRLFKCPFGIYLSIWLVYR